MKFKEFLQKKGIAEDAFSKMEASEQAKLHSEFIDELSKSVEDKPTKEELKAIQDEVEALKANGGNDEKIKSLEETIKELKATVEAQGQRIVENGKVNEPGKMKSISALFKEKYDEHVQETEGNIGKDFTIQSGKQIVIDTKAIVSTDVMPVSDVSDTIFPEDGATGVTNGTIRTLYSRLVGFFAPRIPESRIMEVIDVQPLNEATLIAINESWTGEAEVTPECELKPIVRMEFTTQEATAEPVAAMWFTTTKLRRFFAALANRMEQTFARLVNIQIPQVVLTAIRANASAFTPNAALAINDNPNNYDALGAVIASLENLGYQPNAILMNPIAWRNMKQDKNSEGIYTLSNGQSIQLVAAGLDWGGTTIPYIKDPTLGVDEFIVGDMMNVKAGVDTQLMYMETDGRVDAQATTAVTGLARNIRTHVLEKFVAVIIPEATQAGIVRDTFANVKTLITAEPTT